jgi:PIN domain nuclease of toxin-antitoxin system
VTAAAASQPRNALLLDTHIALWLDSGDTRLRVSTAERIQRCWDGGGLVMLSAVVVLEIAQLLERGRLRLDCPVGQWADRFADLPGIEQIPISHRAAAGAYALPDLRHRDHSDRLLIAQAIEHDCPLVTYDDEITRFADAYGDRYGFSVRT